MYKLYGETGTVREALESINQNKLILPAIQREFVWKDWQVCRLFDSLMQGYPFSTFLFWDIAPDQSNKFQWYGFIREYHARNGFHCPSLAPFHNQRLTAVLDGQQRLTALNIGLQGSMALKEPRLWRTNPNAFPKRHLYLELLSGKDSDATDENRYSFEFRKDSQPQSTGKEYWFKVMDIMGIRNDIGINKWLEDAPIADSHSDQARDRLSRLHNAVHMRPLIFFYREQSENIEEVLNIFVRLNIEGTRLSRQDLLLSMTEAQSKSLDARTGVHNLVDELNGIGEGFAFSKEFIMKSGLMLSDINVSIKRNNFTRTNMN